LDVPSALAQAQQILKFESTLCPAGHNLFLDTSSMSNLWTFIRDNWALILLVSTSGLALLLPSLRKGGGAGLSATEAVQAMNREKAVVVDVCSAEEFAQGHIKGARHIPLDELEQKLPAVVKNKAIPVIVACQTGRRANRGVAIARKLGYDKAQALVGGLRAWRDANLPTEKA
jgi:rhodanese-related sulfurtransferase